MQKRRTIMSFSSSYDEDRLPEGQILIQTSNVKQLLTCSRLLADPDVPYSKIGVVTADAGAGKTIAVQYCQQAIEDHFHSVLPVTVTVKVMPRSTSKILAATILEAMGEPVKGGNGPQISAAAARGIERNDSRLLLFDEGNRLNDDSFEVVQYLLDKTGCPILIVGLPSLWSVIDRQEKFSSRVGLRVRFHPLPLQEVLDVILPNLVFPRWTFDPKNEADRAMGEELWRRVTPSLRKLRNVLSLASKTAIAAQEDTITPTRINTAFDWIMSQEDEYREKKRKTVPKQAQPDSAEQRSVERHQAKDKKRA
jgi:DNA transposition AAA+ family ATPase